jgi:macrolide transport system ATP-binding/permease protein
LRFSASATGTHDSIAILKSSADPSTSGGVPFTVVGVAARRFYGVDSGTSTDLWIPLQSRPELPANGMSRFAARSIYQDPNSWAILMMVRLKPGVTLREAGARLSPIYAQAAYETADQPKPNDPPLELQFVPVRGVGTREIELRQPVRILMGMVFLVLVITCVNVVMLVLARNSVWLLSQSPRLSYRHNAPRRYSQCRR